MSIELLLFDHRLIDVSTFLLNGWFIEMRNMERLTRAGSQRILLPLSIVPGASFKAVLQSCISYKLCISIELLIEALVVLPGIVQKHTVFSTSLSRL
jgi:hypothetical protein